MIHCRFMVEADRPQVVELGRRHVAELTPWLAFDEGRANDTLTRALTRANPTFFVAEEDDELVGYLAAAKVEYAACAGFYIDQQLFYVRPENRRGSRAAAKLFAGFVRWAELQRAEEIFASIGWGDRSGAGARWIRRFGFEPAGQQIMRRRPGKTQ